MYSTIILLLLLLLILLLNSLQQASERIGGSSIPLLIVKSNSFIVGPKMCLCAWLWVSIVALIFERGGVGVNSETSGAGSTTASANVATALSSRCAFPKAKRIDSNKLGGKAIMWAIVSYHSIE